MIDGKNSINNYHFPQHDHKVIDCIRTSRAGRKKNDGGGAFSSIPVQQSQQDSQSFSINVMLSDVLHNLRSRVAGLGIGNRGGTAHGKTEKTVAIGEDSSLDRKVIVRQADVIKDQEHVQSILMTSLTTESLDKRNDAVFQGQESRDSAVKTISGVESQNGGIKGFLRKFSNMAGRVWKIWHKQSRTGTSSSEKPVDFYTGGSSYLLDSYNAIGEYATLAKDHSLDSIFRAKG